MNSNEIRIGNFVDIINRHYEVHLPYGYIKKVGRIEFFKVDLYEWDQSFAVQPEPINTDISDLSPIPLTVEWLIKFGFVSIGQDIKKLTKGNFVEIVVYPTLNRVEINQNTDLISLDVNLKYVHHLQNLYFALTGEELTIKE